VCVFNFFYFAYQEINGWNQTERAFHYVSYLCDSLDSLRLLSEIGLGTGNSRYLGFAKGIMGFILDLYFLVSFLCCYGNLPHPPPLQIAPSSGWWVVLFLFFNEAGAHAELFVCYCCCLFVGEWRTLETRRQRIDPVTDGDARVELQWSGTLECHVSLSWTSWIVVFQTIYLPPRVFHIFFFSRHIVITKAWNLGRDSEYRRPYLKKKKTLCRGSIEKRKRFFSATSSHLCSSSVSGPVTCCFLLKRRFEPRCRQTFLIR